jgi:hypothetical protein
MKLTEKLQNLFLLSLMGLKKMLNGCWRQFTLRRLSEPRGIKQHGEWRESMEELKEITSAEPDREPGVDTGKYKQAPEQQEICQTHLSRQRHPAGRV